MPFLTPAQTPSAVFLKVDVDAVAEVAQRYSVRAMPTFLFIKNRSVVDTLRGADQGRLTALVKQHASSSSSSSFSGAGQTLGGSSSSGGSSRASAPTPGVAQGHVRLENVLPLVILAGYLLYLFAA